MFHSYDDIARANAAPDQPPVLEAFSGTSIVRWYNAMKFKLRDMIRKQEANRNDEYADLLRTYANTWERNPISGSINREVLDLLKAAAEPYAKMDWNQQSFFVGLVTSLDELIADQEQLPSGVDTEQNMGDVGAAGGGMPTSPDFGPEETPPPGVGGGPEDLGGPGGPQPMPGEGGAEGFPGAGPAPGQPGPGPGPGEPIPGQPGPGEPAPPRGARAQRPTRGTPV